MSFAVLAGILLLIALVAGYDYATVRGVYSETIPLPEEILSGPHGIITSHPDGSNMVPLEYTYDGVSYTSERQVKYARTEWQQGDKQTVEKMMRDDPEYLSFRYYTLTSADNGYVCMYEGVIKEGRGVYYRQEAAVLFKYFHDAHGTLQSNGVMVTYRPNLYKYTLSAIIFPIVAVLIIMGFLCFIIEIRDKISPRKLSSR